MSNAHSDDLLHGHALAGLSQSDRDLATAIVLGVLRWQIALDAQIGSFLTRPDVQLATPVVVALRMGAFQLQHLDRIPPHAAINESVEQVRVAGHAHASGMVNALLRKLAGAPAKRKPLVEAPKALAERLAHPLWLVDGWIRAYGRPAAEAICGYDQQQPGCGTLFAQADAALPVMDAGSRLVAELASAVGHAPRRVWDCCAAPGGKTLVLAHRLQDAELIATDANSARLQRLRQRLDRTLPEGKVWTSVADASIAQPELGNFDLILCDVPCSGTGTLARNPEIRHRLQPDALRRQAERQAQILHHSLDRLAPGGRLVYSTCSLEQDENEAVVKSVLKAKSGIRVLPVEPVLQQLVSAGLVHVEEGQMRKWIQGDALRTLPGYGFDGDGFFATVLEKATSSI